MTRSKAVMPERHSGRFDLGVLEGVASTGLCDHDGRRRSSRHLGAVKYAMKFYEGLRARNQLESCAHDRPVGPQGPAKQDR